MRVGREEEVLFRFTGDITSTRCPWVGGCMHIHTRAAQRTSRTSLSFGFASARERLFYVFSCPGARMLWVLMMLMLTGSGLMY